MWFVNTSTLELYEYHGDTPPPYAILSHVWLPTQQEVKFHEMEDQKTFYPVKEKLGYKKIKRFCDIVKPKYEYVWIDTACIDKRSSAELTEAINSMFSWYKKASVVIIYLSDVAALKDGTYDQDEMERCRWFTRGWTLQEMLANIRYKVYGGNWKPLSFNLPHGFHSLCSDITRVRVEALTHKFRLSDFSIAERMSWGAGRDTTRPEDRAYSMMGIFGVNMPVLYGEGKRKAFRRLQEGIMKISSDESLFAWRGDYAQSGLLAPDLDDFKDLPLIVPDRTNAQGSCEMTNVGVVLHQPAWIGSIDPTTAAQTPEFNASLMRSWFGRDDYIGLACIIQTKEGWGRVYVRIERVTGLVTASEGQICGAYRRINCNQIDVVTYSAKLETTWANIMEQSMFKDWANSIRIVLEDEHQELIERSRVLEAERRRAPERREMLETRFVSLGLHEMM